MSNGSTRYLSPLRYPGGKARLASFVGDLIARQPRRPLTYVEPFAGGAGVGLRLLIDEYVDDIVLNDLNPGIAAFWRSVFFDTDEFLKRLAECPVTVDEWSRQGDIYASSTGGDLELGFATFYLNRTNRSGILGARPIGGLDQTGPWKMDARFDRVKLAARIRGLSRYRTRVSICEEEGAAVIGRHLGDEGSFIYADPPYLEKADDLYMDTLEWSDHQALATILLEGDDGWFLTYDADARVTEELYPGLRCARFTMSHTASVQHMASEYAVFASGVRLDSLKNLGTGSASFVVAT